MNETVDPEAAKRAAAPSPPQTRPPRRYGRILLVAVLAVLAVVAWQWLENVEPSTPANRKASLGAPPQTVRAAPTIVGDMPITLNALGTVTPFVTVTVRTQIAGKLQEVGFKEGQTVKSGDFLAQIDPRPYQAALAQAQGQLAKDQALLTQAQGDLTRYETLNKQDSIARQQVEDQAALVAQDKAAIASDQAQIETAQLNLGYTRITSPSAGRVGLRLVDPGNYIQPSDTTGIVVVAEIDPISVVFSIPEDDLARVAARLTAGASLAVTILDRDNVNKLATGTLTTYDNLIDPTTGTIKMRATFDNPDSALFPNQFVNVRILADTDKGATLAPNPAIQIGASGSFVYVIGADDTVAKRDVTVGATDGAHSVIVKGLAPDERLVIDGADRLRDGAKVKIVDNSPAGGAAPAEAGERKHTRQSGAGSDAQGAPK